MRDGRNRYSDRGGYGRRDDRSNFGDRGGFDREMFPAVCDNCGKDCEVPFKPTGNKPIYCSDCFRQMGGSDRDERSDRGDSRRSNFREERSDRRDYSRVESKPTNSTNLNQQFDHLNTKLNKILALLEASALKDKVANIVAGNDVDEEEPVTEVEEVKVKKPRKTAAKKTKKSE